MTSEKPTGFQRAAIKWMAAITVGIWVLVACLAAFVFWPRQAEAAQFSVSRHYVRIVVGLDLAGVPNGGNASLTVIAPGYALTSYHVVRALEQGTQKLAALADDGTVADVTIVATAPLDDLAVVGAPGLECPCVTLGRLPAQDDPVISVGFPKAISIRQQWLTSGLVQHPGGPYIAHSAWTTTGMSGGGLFAYQVVDGAGQWVLVGINKGLLVDRVGGSMQRQEFNNVSYAVPVTRIRAFLEAVKELTP